ncbi:hypothetical protein BDR07DRAFT_1374393 [Suillus spraguei]|nr:hypothetical protein BDR07DRAFT_1374393 [Suillus spraguei]
MYKIQVTIYYPPKSYQHRHSMAKSLLNSITILPYKKYVFDDTRHIGVKSLLLGDESHKNSEGMHQNSIISRAGPTPPPRESSLAALSHYWLTPTMQCKSKFEHDSDIEFEHLHDFSTSTINIISRPRSLHKMVEGATYALGMPKPEEISVWSMDIDLDIITKVLEPKSEDESDGCMDVDGDVVMKVLEPEDEDESDGCMDVDGDVVMKILEPKDESDGCIDDGDVVMEILEPEDESDGCMNVDADIAKENMNMFIEQAV